MKLLWCLLFVASLSWGRSVVPARVVTPPLDLFDGSNKILPNGDVVVKVSTYSKRGVFRHHGAKKTIPKDEYAAMIAKARAVLEMIPDQRGSDEEKKSRRGTAFGIGHNLVLTNNHVLDESFNNTSQCSDFQLRDYQAETFECKKVHYCNPVHDICLIEMAPKIKTKRDCFWCSGTKYEISLADGAALKLKAKYAPDVEMRSSEITTAIGNSAGFGIHYSQGQGVSIFKERVYFYAPITKGNSGGALLNHEGLVIGVVKLQSKVLISNDSKEAFNIAAPVDLVIDLIREGLRDDPETLLKFNQSVIE